MLANSCQQRKCINLVPEMVHLLLNCRYKKSYAGIFTKQDSIGRTDSLQEFTLAVGILYLSHNFFMKSFDPSNAAASEEGPKVGIPALARSFERPATRGASGPTTTIPTPLSRQNDMTALLSEMSKSEIQVASPDWEIPGLPGAHRTELQDGERFRA